MKISDITIKTFKTTADRWDTGHALPLPDTKLMQTVLTIHTDEGVEGHYFGGGSHGDNEGLNVTDNDEPIMLARARFSADRVALIVES